MTYDEKALAGAVGTLHALGRVARTVLLLFAVLALVLGVAGLAIGAGREVGQSVGSIAAGVLLLIAGVASSALASVAAHSVLCLAQIERNSRKP